MTVGSGEDNAVRTGVASDARLDLDAYTVSEADGACRIELAVEGITCAACMSDIERGLRRVPGIVRARVNLSSRRTSVTFRPDRLSPDDILKRMAAIGYPSQPFDPALAGESRTAAARGLLKAMGVAAFGVMNVMLMSIAVWSGNVTDITPETRDFFHWMSALVAMPCVAYAGMTFFRSAVGALRRGSVNMDVPISIGIILAMALSLGNTIAHAREAYFDSALMLTFFLLLGRYLDENMRRRTAVEAETLATLRADSAQRREADGSTVRVPVSRIEPGDTVVIHPGERVPVDGRVVTGHSDIDMSLVTGETLPVSVSEGSLVHAGTLNGGGLLVVSVTAAAEGTLLSEIERLIAEAETARAGTQRLADRAARLYAPVVHASALLTFAGWMIAGAGWQVALVNAIAVLIITCPCALALAVPAVQVVAAGRFFRNGLLLNAGDAIERLAGVDTVVFDKTGTLTEPVPALTGDGMTDGHVRALAGRLALSSGHPLAVALVELTGAREPMTGAIETLGYGVSATIDGGVARLGSPDFCGIDAATAEAMRARHPSASFLAFSAGDGRTAMFAFAQKLRADAVDTVARLRASGLAIIILSGDRPAAVREVADALGVDDWSGDCSPTDKIGRLEALRAGGHRLLMVGDGLNDAPCLAAAHVSLSPVSATHVAQAASDAVFLGRSLRPVAISLEISRRAYRLMMENLGVAVIYNTIAVPIAVLGYVTPLVAALAMSGSSMLVTFNALRLRRVAEPAALAAAVPAAMSVGGKLEGVAR